MVRVITFQSKEVLDLILSRSVYYADLTKSREKWNYKEDVNQLGGFAPVWCFRLPFINDEEKWYRGHYFVEFFSEMSLKGQIQDLLDLDMIELEVPENYLKPGLTHVGCDYSFVMPYIKREWFVVNYLNSVRYVINSWGELNDLVVMRHGFKSDNYTPMIDDNFHVLSANEYRSVKLSLSVGYPLKAFQFEPYVSTELE